MMNKSWPKWTWSPFSGSDASPERRDSDLVQILRGLDTRLEALERRVGALDGGTVANGGGLAEP